MGLALEWYHCFSLIHDDLPCLDNDDFRRGKPSNHKAHGEGIALLAGDALLAESYRLFFDVIHQDGISVDGFKRAYALFARVTGSQGVLGGQILEFELGPQSPESACRHMLSLKTGALFEAAILLPAELLSIDPASDRHQTLSEFSRALGLAFQINDDLEDRDLPEAKKPKSILFYRDATPLGRETHASLKQAMVSLESTFGSSSLGLTRVGDEVLRALARRL